MLSDIENRSNPDETADHAKKDKTDLTDSQENVRESFFQSDSIRSKSPIRSSLSKPIPPVGETVEKSAELSADEFVPNDSIWMGEGKHIHDEKN